MGEYIDEGGTSVKYILVALITITLLSVLLIIREIPAMKLTLQIKKAERGLSKFSRHWIDIIEPMFINDLQFREMLRQDPGKCAGFFRITDAVNNTNFCRGYSVDELSRLFVANPEAQENVIKEFISFMTPANT